MQLETSCLCDAKKTLRCLDANIRPISLGLKFAGTAFTVACCDDFLGVIKALQDAKPGDVLVIDGQQGRKALAGELFSTEAKRKGLAAMIIDGAVRDIGTIREMRFPVYARSIFPTSGTTAKVSHNQIPISCGGVTVFPGDIIFGDDDGVVVVSEAEVIELLPIAEEIQRKESEAMRQMSTGKSLLHMLNIDEHLALVATGKESKLRFLIE